MMGPDDITAWQPRIIAIAVAHAGSDGAHDLNHLHRVWANARAIVHALADSGGAASSNADMLVVMSACYLHDLVNLPKNHPERAMASRHSARAAGAALGSAGFPADRLGAVLHAIEAHSFSANIAAESPEAKIVQDADRLDALGAVGLARLFYTAGQMHSALADGADPLAADRPLDDRAFALDHIVVKLAALPGMMQTEAGRALGEQRLRRLIDFRREFAAEWSGCEP